MKLSDIDVDDLIKAISTEYDGLLSLAIVEKRSHTEAERATISLLHAAAGVFRKIKQEDWDRQLEQKLGKTDLHTIVKEITAPRVRTATDSHSVAADVSNSIMVSCRLPTRRIEAQKAPSCVLAETDSDGDRKPKPPPPSTVPGRPADQQTDAAIGIVAERAGSGHALYGLTDGSDKQSRQTLANSGRRRTYSASCLTEK
jgi:hypothetical protein